MAPSSSSDAESNDGEGWLSSFETALFDEKDGEEKEERCRAAAAFAASRRDMGWRLTHDDLYNRDGQGLIETRAGPIHFERGIGQQGRAWDCSLVLAKYLDSRPEEVQGKGVLELGCGVGLPGVAAAVIGAREVTLTDMFSSSTIVLGETYRSVKDACIISYSPGLAKAAGLPAIERTIELNPAVADLLSGKVLHWGDEAAAAQLLGSARHPVSVVLCSDLLYGDGATATVAEGGEGEEEGVGGEGHGAVGAAEALAITLSAVATAAAAAAGDGGCVILNCHERRWAGDGGAFFFEALARRGFRSEAVDLGDIDDRYRGDCGISFSRICLPAPQL